MSVLVLLSATLREILEFTLLLCFPERALTLNHRQKVIMKYEVIYYVEK